MFARIESEFFEEIEVGLGKIGASCLQESEFVVRKRNITKLCLLLAMAHRGVVEAYCLFVSATI